MVEVLIIYLLFLVLIILQVVTLVLLSGRINSLEESTRTINTDFKEFKYILSNKEPMVETRPEVINNFNTTGKPVATKINSNISYGRVDDEDILFIKEIKLDGKSKVIDMDVKVNNKNK